MNFLWIWLKSPLQNVSGDAHEWLQQKAGRWTWKTATNGIRRPFNPNHSWGNKEVKDWYFVRDENGKADYGIKTMKELTASYQADKLGFIKNPVIAEFLGLASNTDFTEGELEQRWWDILSHAAVYKALKHSA